MTHAIQICTYSSSDWHDWQEYTEWIFDISSDSFKDIVLKRIKEEYRPKNMPDELPDSLDNLNLTVAEAELYDYNMETGEHDLLREIEYAEKRNHYQVRGYVYYEEDIPFSRDIGQNSVSSHTGIRMSS